MNNTIWNKAAFWIANVNGQFKCSISLLDPSNHDDDKIIIIIIYIFYLSISNTLNFKHQIKLSFKISVSV